MDLGDQGLASTEGPVVFTQQLYLTQADGAEVDGIGAKA